MRAALQAANTRGRSAITHLIDSAIMAMVRGDVNRATAELARAAELDPHNAEVLSDLAAAHLQRAATLADPYGFVLALDAVNRAVQLAPALLAARFNRAVALDRLSLRTEALAEWKGYLEVEHDPLWSREARAHAVTLAAVAPRSDSAASRRSLESAVARRDEGTVRAIVARAPQQFREYVEEEVLPAWAMAEDSHHESAARRLLATARAIGASLAASGGDPLAAAAVVQIDHLRSSPRLTRLKRGMRAYAKGMAAVHRGDFTRAIAPLDAAKRTLVLEESPLAGWASFWLAVCRYERNEYDEALATLRLLVQGPGRSPYPALRGRAFMMIGLIEIIEGRPSSSAAAYESALAEFSRLREEVYTAKLGSLIAADYDYIGQPVEAWRKLYSSLVASIGFDAPLLRFDACETAAGLARERGDLDMALWFQDEVVRSARISRTGFAVVEALLSRAEVLVALGRNDAARRDLEEARNGLRSVPDLPTRRSLRGDLLLVRGKIERVSSPRRAVATLSAAVRILRATSYHYRLGWALYERALAEIALDRAGNAERDLANAIAESERQRHRITRPEERISYFDRTRRVIDTMLELQMDRYQRGDAALLYSEQSKARVLRDWLLTQPTSKLLSDKPLEATARLPSAISLSRRLPLGTAAIEYAILPQRLLIWVVRPGKVAIETVPVGAKTLEDLIQRLNHSIAIDRKDVLARAAADLYDTLLRPVAGHISPRDRLVFVPDGPLHTLSFALLRDVRTGRFLVQDHVCSIAPSLQLFVANLDRDRELARRAERRALIIADPDFDPELYPALPRLPGAQTEAVVASAFPGSRVLRDRAATRGAFLRSAGDFQIVHFGGHALVNPQYPLLSQMLFARDARDPARGVLYSGDLLGQYFRRSRLAVLAGCSTATGRPSSTEGVESLAWPFLAAGVPAVVASLWNIDDKQTAEVLSRFYAALQLRFDAAAALQAAQVECIEHGVLKSADPRAWAAFELIGASAPEAPRPGG